MREGAERDPEGRGGRGSATLGNAETADPVNRRPGQPVSPPKRTLLAAYAHSPNNVIKQDGRCSVANRDGGKLKIGTRATTPWVRGGGEDRGGADGGNYQL